MSQANTSPSMGYRLKLLGIGGILGLLLGSGLAAKIWMDDQSALDALQTESEARLAEAEASREALEEERDSCLHKIDETNKDLALLIARVEVARAIVDLDDRNLGLANKHLSEAGKVLAKADQTQVGAVRKRLMATRLVVGGDFESQRAALIGLGNTLDALLGD